MREILFRGKRVDSGEWVVGHLSKGRLQGFKGNTLQPCIDHEENGVLLSSVVDPDTVGQYTGAPDTQGKKIFEGDICRNGERGRKLYRIVWRHGCYYAARKETQNCTRYDIIDSKLLVVGNIHDDPELINSSIST